MEKYRKKTFFLIFIIPLFGFSQNQFLDFVVDRNNDTIYGTIRNKQVLYEKNLNSETDKIKFRSHKLKKYSKFRFNDEIYTYVKSKNEDGIYSQKKTNIPNDSIEKKIGDFVCIEKKLIDFVITKANDTIYGKIEDPIVGKLRLFDASDNRVKIEKDNIKRFRFNNEIFEHKEKRRATIFDGKDAYLKLLVDGNVKLYEYNFNQNDLNSEIFVNKFKNYFYIEMDNELILINNLLYKKRLVELFSKNQNLVSKILNEEYKLDNIYLIVKYYNEHK